MRCCELWRYTDSLQEFQAPLLLADQWNQYGSNYNYIYPSFPGMDDVYCLQRNVDGSTDKNHACGLIDKNNGRIYIPLMNSVDILNAVECYNCSIARHRGYSQSFTFRVHLVTWFQGNSYHYGIEDENDVSHVLKMFD